MKGTNKLLSGKTLPECRQLTADDFTRDFGFSLICYSFMPKQLRKGGRLPQMDTSQRDLFLNP